MTKVHIQQSVQATSPRRLRRVSFGKASLALCLFNVVNLSAIPLKAYISESLPWAVQPTEVAIPSNATFDTFTTITSGRLSDRYNNQTMAPTDVFVRDVSRNTFVLRYHLSLPQDPHCLPSLVRFPGAMFYGLGAQTFVCNFVAQNTTTRQQNTQWVTCHRGMLLGLPIVDACTWIEPVNEFDGDAPEYVVYHACHLWEHIAVSWTKFGLRCALMVYIWRTLWVLYFRHYIPLLRNLRTMGLRPDDDDDVSYVVHLGDPTWLILSHPIVSLAMVIDCFASTPYMGVAGNRVSQVTDLFQFFLGCLYGSRLAWVAYLTMSWASWPIKHWQLESLFDSVDSGWMAVTACVYAGPVMYFVTNSFMMVPFQWMFTLFVAEPMQATETATGTLCFFVLFGSAPLLHSHVLRRVHLYFARRHPRVLQSYASVTKFNDIKQRVALKSWRFLVNLTRRRRRLKRPVLRGGGELHRFVEENFHFKKRPLFCTRAADCYIECKSATDSIALSKIRLSLTHSLDLPPISHCRLPHDDRSVCVLDHTPCTKPAEHHRQWSGPCLHRAASNCPWLM